MSGAQGQIKIKTAKQVRDDIAEQRGVPLPPMLVSSAVTAGGVSPPNAGTAGAAKFKMQMDHLGASHSAGNYGGGGSA